MNTILISSLLGVAAFVLQVATSKETLKASVSVWPPGSNIYLGEYVLLQCSVESNSSFAWSYQWLKHKPRAALASTSNPRHLVSGDSYSITTVTREDAGSYRCQAERWESNRSSVVLFSQPATLSVSELPPPSLLTLTPSTRQLFSGESFTVKCHGSQTNSSSWILRRFPEGRGVKNTVSHTDRCSPLGGAVSAGTSDTCVFTAASGNSGLYWCEGGEGRSNAVHITVSDGAIILKTPSFPVFEGDNVVLYCQYKTSNHSEITFFKDGAEIVTSSSSGSDRVTKMTLENVTQEDEGFYKCASQDRKLESPESWLSVRPDRGNFTSTDWTANSISGSWKWIVPCAVVPLLLILVTVWLVRHYSYQTLGTRRCWSFSKEELPAVESPATKQDVTEVQWDLSWMEMSSLLDKQLYPGT
ncbi:neogenin isoform X1 [Etheostoma spectabile]|uniref:neogenin isoform X1 n=1 Tax=Etheostoma spectabile TaxID=54343 RepID=UPI0013AF3204|nr:neogenin-like isoform X1 [Etheostoma spectabile]XP_032381917.1 neogenin-like isoform X1 [Etheostoma spectabile]